MRVAHALALAALLFPGLSLAQSPPGRATSQTLYLPVYSHIWHGDLDGKGQPARTLVSVLVSIRNTDPAQPIRVTSAPYYDTSGKRIKDYVASPVTIGPLGTHEIFVPRSDDTGGSGANFIVSWKSDAPVSPPVVQAVHANLPGGRSIVFITTAQAVLP